MIIDGETARDRQCSDGVERETEKVVEGEGHSSTVSDAGSADLGLVERVHRFNA